jgi:hypothetical protein
MIGKGKIDDDDDDEDKKNRAGNLFINGGTVFVSEIEFDGKREDAEDFYFSKTFDSLLEADLTSDQTSEPVQISIPQGKYSKIEITVHLSENDSTGYLRLNGSYNSPGQGENNLEVHFSGYDELQEETIEMTMMNTAGEKEITLENYNSKTIEVQFNLNHLFYSFNIERLEEAGLSQMGNEQKIIISDKQNQGIYNSLLPRLEKSFKAIIK